MSLAMFFEFIYSALNNEQLLLYIQVTALTAKTGFFFYLLVKLFQADRISKPAKLLLTAIFCLIIIDISWMLALLRNTSNWSDAFKRIVSQFILTAWIADLAYYTALVFLLKYLVSPYFKINLMYKFIFFFTLCCSTTFLYLMITSPTTAPSGLFFIAMSISSLYGKFILLTETCLALITLHKKQLPQIATIQIRTLLVLWTLPTLLMEFPAIANHLSSFGATPLPPAIAILTALIHTLGLMYSTNRILGMRFLHIEEHVQAKTNIPFVDRFQLLLGKIGHVVDSNEFLYLIQEFMEDVFAVPQRTSLLYIRPTHTTTRTHPHMDASVITGVEDFLVKVKDNAKLEEYIQKKQVLIYNEIAYDNFYNPTDVQATIVSFMETINSDIFLPLYEKNIITGYLTVERGAKRELYNHVERDELIILGRYLSSIVYLMQNKNIYAIIEHEKKIQTEVYRTKQENARYKESVHAFVGEEHRKIGILYYKDRRFTFGNQSAHEIINVNLQKDHEHPLTKAIREIVLVVEDRKGVHHVITQDAVGRSLAVTASWGLSNEGVVVAVYYPEVAGLVDYTVLNKSPNSKDWDYALQLETTYAGKLIKEVLPGNSPLLIAGRIKLLKIALGKEAVLLNAHPDDALAVAHLLHEVSGRKQFETLALGEYDQPVPLATKLFGINPLFQTESTKEGLFESLQTGTLYITSLHYMALSTQRELLDFVKYGYYRRYKSDLRINSDVRLICQVGPNVNTYLQNGALNGYLYEEISRFECSLLNITSLPENEYYQLVKGMIDVVLQTASFKEMVGMNERDVMHLVYNRQPSLQTLKKQIRNLIEYKLKHELYEEEEQWTVTDPELVYAAQLGKNALKDQKIMTLLWEKFKNQNKIAVFLGVNRSSINRRCKEFNLS